MNKKILTFLHKAMVTAIVSVLLFTIPLSASADELSDKLNQKEEIDNEISDIENEIGNTQDILDGITSELENLEQGQELHELTKKNIVESLRCLKNDITELDGQIADLEDDLAEKETLFFQRAKTMYQYTDYSFIDLFLESDGIFDFFDKISTFQKMLKTDRNLMNELTSVRNTLAYKKELQSTVFADKETLLSETEKAIEAIENDKELVQSDYKALTEALNQLAAREEELIQNSEELQGDIEHLENQQQQHNQQQNNQQNNSTSVSPGKPSDSGFIFPLESYVYLSSSFGYRTHPITGQVYSFHSGVDLAAYGGTPIYAAADGKITVAVPVDNGGYGLWIEIEHSNGTRTRYAHCNDIYVKVGDTVKQGQTIAEVGTTGSSTGNHLHFEVLVNGERQNPAGYIVLP